MAEHSPRSFRQGLSGRRFPVAVFLLSCVGAGVVAGIIWAVSAFRPSYELSDDLQASLGERGLANIFASDALFIALMGAIGLLIGVFAWVFFHRSGWWVCVLAVLGAVVTALVAWQAGLLVSPNDFAERLASAVGGEEVPVDLQLHALAALLVAPFAAITPVMLLAAFTPESQPSSPGAESSQL